MLPQLADIVPVLDGIVAPSATRRLPIGGKDLAARLRELLLQKRTSITESEARYIVEKVGCAQERAGVASGGHANVVLDGGRRQLEIGTERHECTELLFQTRNYAADGSGSSLQIAVHEAVISCVEGYDKRDRKESMPVERDLKVGAQVDQMVEHSCDERH